MEYLEKSAECFSDKVAFCDPEREMTFSETVESSKRIGTFIAERCEARLPVAVIMEKNITNISCFFGAVYGGCFYVPIDSAMSSERMRTMLKTLNPGMIITDNENLENVKNVSSEYNIFTYDEAVSCDKNEDKLIKIRQSSTDKDPLYAVFTSGSTGVPKCVLISHAGAVDFFEEFVNVFGFNENDVIGNQAPFDFDVSAKDIYATIISGATMCIIPKQHFSFPKNLISYLNEKHVTSVTWAVSALVIASALGALKTEKPKYINKVLFSGEVMPVKHLNEWRRVLPEATFVNLYGPTEITCNCTYYVVDRDYEETETLPIGKAFKNTKIVLLDEDNKAVTTGGTGEICVAGTCVALGYYNNKEQTQKAFVQNPLNDLYPEIIYRTGDLALLLPDGNMKFMSRKDFQIKHMGHRIELGEIETAVSSIEGIRMCCCIFDDVAKKIILFHESDDLTSRDILQKLASLLPKYMYPNKLIKLEKMPMNKHDKIDRVRLKSLYKENGEV